jgi:hypothetical protein
MSASDTRDFLRLAGELAENVATSNVDFSGSVVAGAKFCFSFESSAAIFSREAYSLSNRNS